MENIKEYDSNNNIIIEKEYINGKIIKDEKNENEYNEKLNNEKKRKSN